MATVRRWYIFLVSAISLQAVTWAVISLLQNLFTPDYQTPTEATAFQIAVIVVGLPIYLVHWLWAQRLAGRDPEERGTALRRLYLYVTLTLFLAPFVHSAYNVVANLLWLIFGESGSSFNYFNLSPGETIIQEFVAMLMLGLLWFYHQRVISADAVAVPETGNAGTISRLYLFGFSAVGLIMTSLAAIYLLRWVMYQFGSDTAIGGLDTIGFSLDLAQLSVGTGLWLIFWQWAQRRFNGPSEAERESTLRKFYLYTTIFIMALSAVTNIAFILAGVFRRVLDLPPIGDIRDPLPIIIGTLVLWVYHTYVLWADARLAGEAPRQAGVRRLYLYLVAAIGLAALLTGLSGDLSVLIRSLAGATFDSDLREELAWFTAALVIGLPVWLLPWRRLQLGAETPGPVGAEERRSIVRKTYLYFYLFVATITVLISAVYIVFRLLSLVLDESSPDNLLSDLGQAIAFILIAAGVWLYHGFILRGDGQIAKREQVKRMGDLRVVVVDGAEGRFGRAVLDELQRELPGLTFAPIGLTPAAAATMGAGAAQTPPVAQLTEAGLIVGPWSAALAAEPASAEIAAAISTSPARKLLIPLPVDGWDWVGLDRWSSEALVRQTVEAVKQIAIGEEVKPTRPLGVGAIIGIIIGVFVLLLLLAIPGFYFFS